MLVLAFVRFLHLFQQRIDSFFLGQPPTVHGMSVRNELSSVLQVAKGIVNSEAVRHRLWLLHPAARKELLDLLRPMDPVIFRVKPLIRKNWATI